MAKVNKENMTKEELEKIKLNNEIYFQENPLKNPANWVPFATLVGACFALIYGLCSGWFGTQNSLLELKREHLIDDIKQYKADTISLRKEIRKKNLELLNTKVENNRTKDSLLTLEHNYQLLKEEHSNLDKMNRILNQKVISLSDKKLLNILSEVRLQILKKQYDDLKKYCDYLLKGKNNKECIEELAGHPKTLSKYDTLSREPIDNRINLDYLDSFFRSQRKSTVR